MWASVGFISSFLVWSGLRVGFCTLWAFWASGGLLGGFYVWSGVVGCLVVLSALAVFYAVYNGFAKWGFFGGLVRKNMIFKNKQK